MRWTCGMLATICAWVLSGAGPVAQKPPLKNPYEGNADAIRNGMGCYRARCADCHGIDARGVRAPDLTQVWASGRTDEGLFKTVRSGVPDTEMPAFVPPRTSDRDIWQMLAYLRTLAAPAPTDPPRGNAENGEKIFRAMCAGCHRVNGAGGRLGPDLSRIGVARSRDAMVARIRRGLEDFRRRLRAGDAHAARGTADPGREEERGSVLGPDHGHARAHPGLREGQGEGGAERHPVGDAGLRPRSPERQRSRRSASLPADAARLRSAPFSNRRSRPMRRPIARLRRPCRCCRAPAPWRSSPSRRRRRS